jgi:hypothetical protein
MAQTTNDIPFSLPSPSPSVAPISQPTPRPTLTAKSDDTGSQEQPTVVPTSHEISNKSIMPTAAPTPHINRKTHQPTMLFEKTATSGIYNQVTQYSEGIGFLLAILFFLFILRPKYMRHRNFKRFERLSSKMDTEARKPINDPHHNNNNNSIEGGGDLEFEEVDRNSAKSSKKKKTSKKKSTKQDNVFQDPESSNGLLSAGHNDEFAWDDEASTCEI